jgi:hypothetical protein
MDGAGGRGNLEKSHLDSLLIVIRNIYISASDSFLIVQYFECQSYENKSKTLYYFRYVILIAIFGTGSCVEYCAFVKEFCIKERGRGPFVRTNGVNGSASHQIQKSTNWHSITKQSSFQLLTFYFSSLQ